MSESKAPRKEKVIWSKNELQTVIDAAVLISLDDTDHLWTHFAKAQQHALPPSRHRRIGGKHIITDEILAQFKKAREEVLSSKEKVEVPVEVHVPAPVDRAAVIATITNAEIFELVAQRLGPFITTGIKALSGIAEILANRPERHNAPEVETLSPSAKASTTPNPASTTTIPTVKTVVPKKTKVLLFGFSGQDEVKIRQKAVNFNLELFFVSQPPDGPVPSIPICDWGIVNRNPPLSRRAKMALDHRPGKAYLKDAGTVETALKWLNDINSKQR